MNEDGSSDFVIKMDLFEKVPNHFEFIEEDIYEDL